MISVYRYSFKQTLAEFEAPSGYWKVIVAAVSFVIALATLYASFLNVYGEYFTQNMRNTNAKIIELFFQCTRRCRRPSRTSIRRRKSSALSPSRRATSLARPSTGTMRTTAGRSRATKIQQKPLVSPCFYSDFRGIKKKTGGGEELTSGKLIRA